MRCVQDIIDNKYTFIISMETTRTNTRDRQSITITNKNTCKTIISYRIWNIVLIWSQMMTNPIIKKLLIFGVSTLDDSMALGSKEEELRGLPNKASLCKKQEAAT